MEKDEYWNKFISSGSVESYLNYVEHIKSKEIQSDATKWADHRRTDNTGNTNR